MRRFLLVLGFTVLGLNSAHAQDLVITTENDSIECKITKQDGEFVYITYVNDNGVQSVLIENERVKSLTFGFFDDPVPEVSKNRLKRETSISEIPKSTVHLSGSFIFSRRIAPISNDVPDDFQDYLDDLRGGRGYQGRLHFFATPTVAIGLQVSTFESSNSISVELEFDNPDSIAIGTLSTSVSMFYLGPSLMGFYYFPNSSFLLNYSLSFGYLGFRQEETLLGTEVIYEGSSLGMNGDLGLEFLLAKNVAFGIGAGFGLGSLNKVDITVDGRTESVDLEEAEGLGRISFFTGLRFHF